MNSNSMFFSSKQWHKMRNNAHKFDNTNLFLLVGISLGRGHPFVSGMEMKYRITSITPRIARMR